MGKYTAFKLPLKSLGVGTHEFSYRLDRQFFENMESSDIHGADLEVLLAVQYNGDFYTLDFRITGEVILICDRCLDDLHFPIDASYHIVVKYGETYNDDSDEVLEIPDSDSTLNVAYMIKDTVELAIPMKHVHPQGKCNRQMSAMLKKHRAAGTGEDAELEEQLIDEMEAMDDAEDTVQTPTDPRWNALRKFSEEDNNIE